MDIAARPDDPALDEMARSIYAMFPRCVRCGEPIPRYEDADVRILTHRVVHRDACAGDTGQASAASDSVERSTSSGAAAESAE